MHPSTSLSLLVGWADPAPPVEAAAAPPAGATMPSLYDPVYVGMALLVFLVTVARFNHLATAPHHLDVPGPARSFTTFPRYAAFSLLYGLLFVFFYAVAVFCLRNEAFLQVLKSLFAVTGQLPELKGSPPVIAGCLLAFLSPSIPVLGQLDMKLREALQRTAGAPDTAWDLARELSGTPLRLSDREVLDKVRAQFAQAGDFAALLKQGSVNPRYRFAEIVYLQTGIDLWAQRNYAFHRFKRQNNTTYAALMDRIEGLKPILTAASYTPESASAPLVARDLEVVWTQLLRFVSCGVLCCTWSESARRDRLMLLGFSTPGARDSFDWVTPLLTFPLTILSALVSAAALGWFVVLPLVNETRPEGLVAPLAWRACEMALLHTAAIFAGLTVRHFEGRKRPAYPAGYRRAGELDLGFMLAEMAIGWSAGMVTALALDGLAVSSTPAPEVLLNSALVGIPTAAAAASFAWLVSRRDESVWAPLFDTLTQGATTALATLMSTSVARQLDTFKPAVVLGLSPELLGATPEAAEGLMQLAAVTVAGSVGACIGFLLPARYRMKVAASDRPLDRSVAVVGAGIAGLACASRLREAGFQVMVFEREAKLGGRMASTMIDGCTFDLGAQRFDVVDGEFGEVVQGWVERGHAKPWDAKECVIHPDGARERVPAHASAYVGVPDLGALVRDLASGCHVQCGTRIGSLKRSRERWILFCEEGHDVGVFDYVVLAVPAPDALDLLQGVPALQERAARAAFSPCWTVLLGFDAALEPKEKSISRFDIGVFAGSDALHMAACESQKPGREAPANVAETWVLHAKTGFSAARLQAPPKEIIDALMAELWRWSGFAEKAPVFAYARLFPNAYVAPLPHPPKQLPETAAELHCEFDASGVGLCGDWCIRTGAGHAWRSGATLATRIIEHYRTGAGRRVQEAVKRRADVRLAERVAPARTRVAR